MLREDNIRLRIMLRNPFADALFLLLNEVRRREYTVHDNRTDAFGFDELALVRNLILDYVADKVTVDLEPPVDSADVRAYNGGQIRRPVDAWTAAARKRPAEADDGHGSQARAIFLDDGVNKVLAVK
jgi:hypothetical protein